MGKHKNVEAPEDLLNLWVEYKNHVDETPHIEEVATAKGVFSVARPRPYLRQGFQSYVFENYGYHVHQYIDNYAAQYADYLGVVTYMRNDWEDNQISGSLTGRYRAPNLVARLNNIAEKIEDTTPDKPKKLTVTIKRKNDNLS